MSLLVLKGISRNYRRGGVFARRPALRVLRGTSLTIGAGECVALVGPSGSGKSTLARIALGLERPDAGQLLFDGRPLTDGRGRMAKATRNAIQAVFQDPFGATSPRLTAFEVIAEPLRYARISPDVVNREVQALAAAVALNAADLGRPCHRYSGGQVQRMCIARALALKPRLVVLDEAVSNLDLTTQAIVLDMLAGLRRRLGTAYLFITHDLRLVQGFADRLYVMDEGRAIEADPLAPEAAEPIPALARLRAALLPALPPGARLEPGGPGL